MEKIIERFERFMRHRGLRDAQVHRECGLANGTLGQARKEGRDLGKKSIDSILGHYPDLNRVWLLTGEGEMLNSVKPTVADGTIMIPQFNMDTRGGSAFNVEVDGDEYVTNYIPFPTSIARQGDVVIPIYGESMEPTYKSGSLVLIRKVELWREYLEFGCTYVIALVDDRRMIKTVMAGSDSDHFMLVSINPANQPQEVPKNIIRSVWRVILSVRRESL